jgi:hypothetical protein
MSKKSPCFGESKHIFKLKIALVIPKKNGFKKARDLLFLLYSSAADLGKQEKPDRFVIFTRYFRLQNVIFKKCT